MLNPYEPPDGELAIAKPVEDITAFGWRVPPLGLGVAVVGYLAHAIDMFTWGREAAVAFTVVAILLLLLYIPAAMRKWRSSSVAMIAVWLQTLLMFWMLIAQVGLAERVILYNGVFIIFFVAVVFIYRALNGWYWIRD